MKLVPTASSGEPNRWPVLALLGVAQPTVTLDVTIVKIPKHTATPAREVGPPTALLSLQALPGSKRRKEGHP